MRIYVDARCLQDPSYGYRGVGLHTATVLADLRAHLPDAGPVTAILDPDLPPLDGDRVSLFDAQCFAAMAPPDGETACFLQPSPMTHDQDVLAPLLKLARVYSAAVVYDFIPLEDPERYLSDVATRRAYASALVSLRGYQRYLSISEHTATIGEQRVGLRRRDVTVTGVAVRDAFWAAAPPRATEGRYFFSVGGDDPRKNVECAVRAHAAVSRSAPETALWILGRYSERSLRRLRQMYAAEGGRPGRLRFIHGTSDQELASLYRGAAATLCPSRSEGFSIPVVEAIAAGCPALVADCPAQRELMPLEDALFAPDDPARLAALIQGVLAPGAREALLDRQHPFARRFARAEVSGRFWAAVRGDLARWRFPPPRPPSMRPRIAVCSPYPPVRSGVADYTAETVRALARYADVDVLSTQDAFSTDPSVRRFRYLTALPYVREEYDRIVAVIGNSDVHARIIDLVTRYGGPCISHDNRMAEQYHLRRGALGFNALAEKILHRRVSISESEAWIRNPARLPTLFFEEILTRAEPFIVHSRILQRELACRHHREIAYLPFSIYRNVESAELTPDARRAARARLGIPDDRLAIVTLGIVHATKAPRECITAIRMLGDAGMPAHLYFVGSADRTDDLLRHAKGEGVADRVHLPPGWTSDERYRDFLQGADVAIQLRTHGFGGLSGAALDCIAHGLPTVVNADLAEALEAPSYVEAVRDAIDPAEIASRVRELVAAGAHLERATPARDVYVAQHGFDAYARGLLALLGLPPPR